MSSDLTRGPDPTVEKLQYVGGGMADKLMRVRGRGIQKAVGESSYRVNNLSRPLPHILVKLIQL